MESKRSQWSVSTDSYSFRLYQWWRSMGGGGPQAKGRPIDLCHFMRVIMFWVWLRWFFASKWMPWVWVVGAGVVAVNYIAYTIWPDVMSKLFLCYLGVAAIISLLYILSELLPEFGRGGRLEGAGIRIENGLASFFGGIGRGFSFVFFPPAIWLWRHALEPFGKWFFMRPFYWRLYPWMIIPLAVLVGFFVTWPGKTSSIVGLTVAIVVGLALIALALGFIVSKIGEWVSRRKVAKAAAAKNVVVPEGARVVEKKVSQRKEFARLWWQYLVSRKHRICPLIVPEDGPTADN